MTRHFCDHCGDELTPQNKTPASVCREKKGRPDLVVILDACAHGVIGEGEFCKYCVIDAVKQLDDRPTLAQG